MAKPTDADLNALDITDAEAAEINRIAHPLVAGAAPDADNDLVLIDSTPDGVVFVTINRPSKKNAFDAATIGALFCGAPIRGSGIVPISGATPLLRSARRSRSG